LGKLWRILVRFGLWWAGLFGLVGTGTCPCCGQAGCPGGAAGTGLLSALGAGLLTRLSRTDRKSSGDTSTEAVEKTDTTPCQ
jgi:hypothetical protein